MKMNFYFYVPPEYTFEGYFSPKVDPSSLEFFEVDRRRRGIQRKGNNHLVVFLDSCVQAEPARFLEPEEAGMNGLRMRTPAEKDLFNRLFGGQKEVAVFALSYHARMSVIAWKITAALADDERILVKNDAGNLMAGRECAHELKSLLGMI